MVEGTPAFGTVGADQYLVHPLLITPEGPKTILHRELVVLARAVYFEDLNVISLVNSVMARLPTVVWSDKDVVVLKGRVDIGTAREIARFYIDQIEKEMEG